MAVQWTGIRRQATGNWSNVEGGIARELRGSSLIEHAAAN
jgi:hypothetical protein